MSVQRQTKVKIHKSYVITFDIWQSLYYELMLNNYNIVLDTFTIKISKKLNNGEIFVYHSLGEKDNQRRQDRCHQWSHRPDPTVQPGAITIFTWTYFVLQDLENRRITDERTYERTTCVKILITTCCDCESASWIKIKHTHWHASYQLLSIRRTNVQTLLKTWNCYNYSILAWL